MDQKISHDSEVPAHGQQVISACALLHHNFDGEVKIFLPKRADTKKFLPGVFEIPGGHIDFGEDIVDGLKREIKEEFGADINVGDPFASFTYLNEVKGSHSIEVIYFATFVSPIDAITLHPDDHAEYRWFSENEVDQAMNDIKGPDDPEIAALYKAFKILRGESPNFG